MVMILQNNVLNSELKTYKILYRIQNRIIILLSQLKIE